MTAQNYTLNIKRGATYTLAVIYKDSNGEPLTDFSTYSAKLQIIQKIGDTVPVVSLAEDDGLTLDDSGRIDVEITAAETGALDAAHYELWSLVAISPLGAVIDILEGSVRVHPTAIVA